MLIYGCALTKWAGFGNVSHLIDFQAVLIWPGEGNENEA